MLTRINNFNKASLLRHSARPILFARLSSNSAFSKVMGFVKKFNDTDSKQSKNLLKYLRMSGIISMLIPVGTLIYVYSEQPTPQQKEVPPVSFSREP